LARARDWVVSSIVEMVAEQRTLWSLRDASSATLVYPSDFATHQEIAERNRILVHARRHHGVWLVIDAALFAGSGVFVLIPGPNVLAYYFAVRVVGHYLCWRGAGQALTRTIWETRSEPALAELGSLVNVPREARAPRVAELRDEGGLARQGLEELRAHELGRARRQHAAHLVAVLGQRAREVAGLVQRGRGARGRRVE
jgi:hypothetical protein